MPDDYEKIKSILDANKDKLFVKRILNPENYPTLDLGDGNYATHKMAYSQVGNKYIVYPTVLYDGNQLKQFSPQGAINQNLQTGNYISFDSPDEADWFSQNYKKYWNKPSQ